MMQFLRRSLIGVLLMALTLGGVGWAGLTVYDAVVTAISAEAPAMPARETVLTVNTATVTSGTQTPVLETFGEIRSRRTLELRASAAGSIVEMADTFEDGGTVAAGDLLLRIDPAAATADLALARADLSEAEAELREAQSAIELAQDDLAAAEEQADLRAQSVGRQQDLQARGVGSAAAVETAALAASSANQAVVSRRQALAEARSRVDLAATSLERMKIAVTLAERDLADTEIRARFDGTLSDVTVVEGGLVSVNENIGLLVDPDALEVAFRLSTTQYTQLLDADGKLGKAPVEVVMEVAGLDLSTQGVIERESAVVGDGQTGRLIYARIDTARGFRPGDFVTVRISEPEMQNVALLPALSVDAAGTVLVLSDEMRLDVATVEVLRRQGDYVLVRAPSLEGREVVAEQTPLLGAGIRVRSAVAEREPETAQAADDEMVSLTTEQREKLIAFVRDNKRMPEEVRNRVLAQLEQDQVPAQVVERLQSRMGS